MSDILSLLKSELATSSDDTRALDQEIARLQERRKLSVDKVQQLQKLIETYEVEQALRPDAARQQETLALPLPVAPLAVSEPPAAPRGLSGVETPPPPPDAAARISKKARMIQEIDGLLATHGTIHRSQILQHLIGLGVMGHEKNPMVHLSIFLTNHRSRYVSDGSGNYHARPPLRTRPSSRSLSLEDATSIVQGQPEQSLGRELAGSRPENGG